MSFLIVPGNVESTVEVTSVVKGCCIFYVDEILEMLQIMFVLVAYSKVIHDKCEGYLFCVVCVQPFRCRLFITIFLEVFA